MEVLPEPLFLPPRLLALGLAPPLDRYHALIRRGWRQEAEHRPSMADIVMQTEAMVAEQADGAAPSAAGGLEAALELSVAV